MGGELSVEQLIQQFIKDNPEYKNKPKDEIISIMAKQSSGGLTDEQKISLYSAMTVT